MATRTINPQSNPYGGGAVIFDSTPYVDFFVKQQIQEKAKDEALEKYLMDFDKTINPAGMRNNDVAPFLQKVAENKNFYLKNKEAIKNPALDNGAAYSQWYNANKEALGEIQKSKMLAQKDARFSKVILDAKKDGKTITDGFQKRYELFRSLPMNDPRFVDINEEDVSFNNKPFNQSEFTKNIFAGIDKSKRVVSSKKDPQTMEIIDMVEEYIPEKLLPTIKSRAAYEYQKDPSFKEVVDATIFDENKINELNAIYKPLFKKPIETREDIAAAIALSLSGAGKITPDSKPDWVGRNKIQSQQSDARTERLAAAKNAEPQYNPKAHVLDIYEFGSKDPLTYTIKGEQIRGREISIPEELEDKYFDKVRGRTRRPDKVIMTDDKKKIYLIKYTGEKTKSGNDVIDRGATRVVNVGSDFIPALAKAYGGVAFTRKNIYNTEESEAGETNNNNPLGLDF